MRETAFPGIKRLAVPFLIVVVAVLAALLLFEILLRGIGYSAPIWYQPDPQLGWTLRPGIAAWAIREGRGYVEVNAAGWRDQDHPLDKPANIYRIAVLGDSYAEAMQVSREETFWALLPERLAACGFWNGKQRIEVMNFGVSSYGTAQEYLVLESKAMRYRPDLVLLQFTNGNDVTNNSKALENRKIRPFYVLDRDGELRLDNSFSAAPEFLAKLSPTSEAFRKMANMSRVVQLVNAARALPLLGTANAAGAGGVEQGMEPEVLAPPRDPLWDEAWRVTEKLVAKTDKYARRNGARFLVVTIPYAIQVHPDAAVRAELQNKLGVADLFYPDRRITGFAHGHDIDALALAPEMQRLAEERNIYFHGFANNGMGRGHWNADGHRVAAELIARHLCGQQP